MIIDEEVLQDGNFYPVTLTEFYGGCDYGPCLQLTQQPRDQEQLYKHQFIQLTMKQARILRAVLNDLPL